MRPWKKAVKHQLLQDEELGKHIIQLECCYYYNWKFRLHFSSLALPQPWPRLIRAMVASAMESTATDMVDMVMEEAIMVDTGPMDMERERLML